MPQCKKITSLKTLCLRTLAWPDAIQKSTDINKNFPTVETYVRNVFISKHFEKTRELIKKKHKRNMAVDKNELRQYTEAVINTWIKLSNFYETRLNEIESMAPFMKLSSVGTLDFLHEGFTMRDEKNFLHKILPYIGVIPYTLRPQQVDFRTWIDIVTVMVREEITENLEHLFISFGNIKILREERTKDLPEEEIAHINSALVFRFTETFEYFMNLRTIVVRGNSIQDDFMNAVGENCVFLEHLDIRGTQVTDRGVVLLLFKKAGERFFRGCFIPNRTRFRLFSETILNPCCSTLKYLDISGTVDHTSDNSDLRRFYDMCIPRACPLLRATPLQFYQHVPGRTRVILKDLFNASEDPNLVKFRQQLVRYLRQSQTERVFEFARMLFTYNHFEDPKLEVMENETGEETAFLFISGSAMVLHMEVENLSAITLVSYARNVTSFIPIDLIAKTAPRLQKLKCSLRGTLTETVDMRHLRYLTCPMVREVETLKSIIEHCPALEYVEVQGIHLMDPSTQFGQDAVESIFCEDPGHYKSLEVIRFLFENHIVLYPGLSWIAVRCPRLRIVGDLGYWGVPYDTLMRIFANTSLYHYDFAIEHNGVLHFSGKGSKDITKFE